MYFPNQVLGLKLVNYVPRYGYFLIEKPAKSGLLGKNRKFSKFFIFTFFYLKFLIIFKRIIGLKKILIYLYHRFLMVVQVELLKGANFLSV